MTEALMSRSMGVASARYCTVSNPSYLLREEQPQVLLPPSHVARETLDAGADEPFPGDTVQPAGALVHVEHDLAFWLEDQDSVVGQLEEAPVIARGPVQRLLRLDALQRPPQWSASACSVTRSASV